MELRAMRRQAVAELIQARLGDGNNVGLQLRGEPFTYLGVSINRIIIVVLTAGLLGDRHRCSGQEEKELHRNSVCRWKSAAEKPLAEGDSSQPVPTHPAGNT